MRCTETGRSSSKWTNMGRCSTTRCTCGGGGGPYMTARVNKAARARENIAAMAKVNKANKEDTGGQRST